MPADKAKIADMSLDEKCEWLDEIWASLEGDPSFHETPDWHRSIISERLHRMQTNPHPGLTIDELFSKLASRRK